MNKFVRIAIDARQVTSVIDGLGRYVLGLIEALKPLDNQTIIIFHTSDFPSNLREKKKELEFIKIDLKAGNPLQHLIIPMKIRKLNIDVYYYPFIDPPLFSPAKMNVFAIHDLNHFFFSKYAATEKKYKILAAKVLIWLSVKFYNKVIVFSNHIKNQVESNINSARNMVEVIYHGLSPDDFLYIAEDLDFNFKAKNLKPFILYVGNNRPHKNIQRLMNAFNLFLQKQPDFQLVLAGNHMDRFFNAMEYAKQMGFEDKVKKFNNVTNTMLAELYKNASLVFYPSISEGFGFPILESWFFRTPIVTSNTSCIPEIGMDAVMYIDPFDLENMVQGLEKTIKEEVSNDLIEKGKERLKTFSWNSSAKQHLEVFEKVNSI